MKSKFLNNCFKLLIWLWVLAIIVMLLIPKELTDSQLAQIKPGMAIDDVQHLLGAPCNEGIYSCIGNNKRPEYIDGWHVFGEWWKPGMHVSVPEKTIEVDDASYQWIGSTQVLWVVHNKGIVMKTWLFPIERHGGGLQGCINTIKDYWNRWWK